MTPRSIILFGLPGLIAALIVACGGSLELPPTPTATRVPVQAPTAPGAPTTTAASAVEVATLTPTSTPTEAPAGALEPLATPTEPPPEPTATPEPPAVSIEFDPPQLVQGGATIIYFNEAASAATANFGGRQYPMLFDGTRWWAIVGIGALAQTGQAPVTVTYNPADGSAQTSVSGAVAIVSRDFPVEYIELSPSTASLLQPDTVYNEISLRESIFSGYTLQRMWDGVFVAPSNGPLSGQYGEGRSYNGGPVTDYHRGTDFVAGEGAPVFAAAAGRVVFVDQLQIRGNTIIIDHGVGVFTAYCHLSDFSVSVGEMVAAGDLIGAIGSTGLATGPHLHWEVVVRGIEVDGELWLTGGP